MPPWPQKEMRLSKVQAALDALGAVLFGSGITYGAYTVRPWLAAVVAGLLLLFVATLMDKHGRRQ